MRAIWWYVRHWNGSGGASGASGGARGRARGGEDMIFMQLLSGKDVARPDQARMRSRRSFRFAENMVNFQYVIGDATGECVAVDAAWDPAGIRKAAEASAPSGEGPCRTTAFVATHHHWDHIGGSPRPGAPPILGLRRLRAVLRMCRARAESASERTGVRIAALTPIDDGDDLAVGAFKLRFHATPGHSLGSMVITVHSPMGAPRLLVAGDTLFPGSCGRIDLPDSDPIAMYHSLQQVVAGFNDSLAVYPGHGYSGKSTTIGDEKLNGLLRPMSERNGASAICDCSAMCFFFYIFMASNLPPALNAAR